MGGYLLQQWSIELNDKNGKRKLQFFIKSTKRSTPTPDSGPKSLSPIKDSFKYIETNANKFGTNLFCSFQRTHIIRIEILFFIITGFPQEVIKQWVNSEFNCY